MQRRLFRPKIGKRHAPKCTLPLRWRRWLQQYAIIIVFVITLAILAVTAVRLARRTDQIATHVHTIAVQQQVVVDPRLDSAEAGGASILAGCSSSTQNGKPVLQTSGNQVPSAAARGNVIFANRLPEAVTIPAGTRVSTSGDQRIVFQTVDSAELPVTVNSQVEVAVVAIEPGISGNIEPGRSANRVAGALATQVRVRNAEPTEGGAVRAAPAVAQIDIDNLNAHIREHLVELAHADMRDKLQPGEGIGRRISPHRQIIDENNLTLYRGRKRAAFGRNTRHSLRDSRRLCPGPMT